MPVGDVMSSPAITLRPPVPVPLAAARLVQHGVTGAPVPDAEGLLVAARRRARTGRAGRADEGADRARDLGGAAVRRLHRRARPRRRPPRRPDEEVAEALGVGLLTSGGPATVYGPRALAAFRAFRGQGRER